MTRAIDALARSALDLQWNLDPVAGTAAGLKAYDTRYGRFSADQLRPHLAALRSVAGAVEQAEVGSLDEEIDRTALLDDLRLLLHRLDAEGVQRRDPEFHLSHVLSGLYYPLVRSDYARADRVAAVRGRLADLPAFLDDAREALDAPARLFAGTALAMVDGGRELLDALAPVFPEAVGELGRAAAALTSFAADLERWRETGDDTVALGEEAFTFRLHHQHALGSTAPELWRYGLALVREVEDDLTRRARALGGGWPDVAARLREEHPAHDALVTAYDDAMERARAFVLERGLAPVPDCPLEVVATPTFMTALIPIAAYHPPGPYATDRTGWFYVTVPDAGLPSGERERLLRQHCIHALGSTALHEGFPGHHLQLSLAQQGASEVRRNVWSPITVEGWALYCEEMMAEEGFLDSPEQRFFQRVHLLLRAVRILLDVGIHTRGMTVEEGVAMLIDRVHLEPAHAEAEVRRYCAQPTYPLAYAVGRRELLALRQDFIAKGGSLPEFHRAVLAYGGLPVSLIRWGLGLGPV